MLLKSVLKRSDDPDYKVCEQLTTTTCSADGCIDRPNNATELHFMYPASWQPETRNITAFIHLNEEAIDHGDLEHVAWYTVDGKKYSWWYHDMMEWVYPDEADKGPIFDAVEDELMVANNASQICFEDIGSYMACSQINNNTTEIHFTYPAAD